MANAVRTALWIVVPFSVTLLVASAFVPWRGEVDMPALEQREMSQQRALQLVGHAFQSAALIEAQSRAPIVEQGLTIPDTAVVILLGAIGCSLNQMRVLQYWSESYADADSSAHPVLTIHADPIMNPGAAAIESLLLRRVSRATFPFLVSTDTTFSPRAMNIRTPQVVLVESGVITKVMGSAQAIKTPLPVIQRPSS